MSEEEVQSSGLKDIIPSYFRSRLYKFATIMNVCKICVSAENLFIEFDVNCYT